MRCASLNNLTREPPYLLPTFQCNAIFHSTSLVEVPNEDSRSCAYSYFAGPINGQMFGMDDPTRSPFRHLVQNPDGLLSLRFAEIARQFARQCHD